MTCSHDEDVLASAPTGSFHGPLAHGFACGAHLAVHNKETWNAFDKSRADRRRHRKMLLESWDITTAAGWTDSMETLQSGDNTGSDGTHIVLGIREALIERYGSGIDLPIWREAITNWCEQEELPEEAAPELNQLAGTIVRYEARFRADDLLPPDGRVRSTLAYDLGRAVNMARWGVSARLCDVARGRAYVQQAGESAQHEYHSWQDYSAAYIMGRVVRFDKEQFDHWYIAVLRGHRFLLSEPDSPWRTIPFK